MSSLVSSDKKSKVALPLLLFYIINKVKLMLFIHRSLEFAEHLIAVEGNPEDAAQAQILLAHAKKTLQPVSLFSVGSSLKSTTRSK